jgi:hypothetical protein
MSMSEASWSQILARRMSGRPENAPTNCWVYVLTHPYTDTLHVERIAKKEFYTTEAVFRHIAENNITIFTIDTIWM